MPGSVILNFGRKKAYQQKSFWSHVMQLCQFWVSSSFLCWDASESFWLTPATKKKWFVWRIHYFSEVIELISISRMDMNGTRCFSFFFFVEYPLSFRWDPRIMCLVIYGYIWNNIFPLSRTAWSALCIQYSWQHVISYTICCHFFFFLIIISSIFSF